jgi:phosphoribosylglycinamide formyltransferase-1
MKQPKLLLLVENDFYSSFLLSMWLQTFSNSVVADSILVRDDPPVGLLTEIRQNFHNNYRGQTLTHTTVIDELYSVYPNQSDVALSLIDILGVPDYSVASLPSQCFLGKNVNCETAKACLRLRAKDDSSFLFIFVDQLLDDWWIDFMSGRILNGHPAVLPYARGFRAIEGIARKRDESLFRLSCGASIHYVDNRIDAGPIVRVERLRTPFAAPSLHTLRAQLFALVFKLLIETANNLIAYPEVVPAGVVLDNFNQGYLFFRRDSTQKSQREAAESYLAMKHAAS